MAYTQANRPMRVETALGPDVLLLEAFSGVEEVSRPFTYTLDLLSEDPAIVPDKVLRTPVCLTIAFPDGSARLVHGMVRSFSQLGQHDELVSYRAEVVPWIWFLSLSFDCKIFQNLSVPEIVDEVFSGLGYTDYKFKLVKPHPKQLFTVQYRESHLNFVSRLLEEEGIFYFFEHTDGKHELVLADDNSAVKPCPVQSVARMASTPGPWQEEDVVTACECEDAVHTGKMTLRDYDPQQPLLQLESSVAGTEPEEWYDYPGGYTTLDEGDRLARIQLEAEEATRRVVRGAGTCRSFQIGYRFDLKDHYRKDANQSYMLLELRHSGRAGDYLSWDSATFDYRNDFVCIPHSVPYRPARTTPTPRIWGSQTALVVGKAGEEIWTDKHGRIKVQFYWDRLGKKDENSSCWIRVAQPWAGKGWGSLSIPRIGQEVVVEFLYGNPNLPIVTGSVYNADQTPPYDPGKGGVVSGNRSNTHKGKGYNEMSLDDTAGKEKITVHGQYDMSTTVGHDQSNSIGNNRTTSVAVDDTTTIGANKALTVGSNSTESVGGSKSETISIAKALSIGAAYQVSVGAAMNETVGAAKLEEIGGAKVVGVGGISSETVGASKSVKAGSNISETAGAKFAIKAGSNIGISSGATVTVDGKKVIIDAKSQIVLKCGGASVVLKSGGDILIKGSGIKIQGSGVVKIKGSEIKEN